MFYDAGYRASPNATGKMFCGRLLISPHPVAAHHSTSSSATFNSGRHRYSRGLPRPEVRGLRHSRGQSREHRRGRHRHKGAPDVPHSVQPPIRNLKRQEHSSRPKHTPNFSKSEVLQLFRAQVMKHQDRDSRRKCPVRQRQRRSIPLNHRHTHAIDACTELRRKRVVTIKTCNPRGEMPQLLCCCTRPRAKLKDPSSEPSRIHGRSCRRVT